MHRVMGRRLGKSTLAMAVSTPLVVVSVAPAAGTAPIDGDWALCGAETARLERRHGIPDRLLTAISLVEAGRRDAGTGRVRAWPWAVMAQGRSRYLRSKADAIREVQRLQSRGVRNIDVGCMQVNLFWHAGAFQHLAEAFDPETNVAYAAEFLTRLYHEERSWNRAVARYHSRTPHLHERYGRKVRAAWRLARRNGSETAPPVVARGKPGSTAPATSGRGRGAWNAPEYVTGRQVRSLGSPKTWVIVRENRRHVVLKPAAAGVDTQRWRQD